MFRISSKRLDPEALRRELLDTRAGAYVSFEGRVRQKNAGRRVRSLEYETYNELAEKEGTRIIAEALERFAIYFAACVHRRGHLRIGEVAVWAGVTAEHRGAAFAACRYVIDEMKKRVPIWKKEHYATGDAAWIDPGTGEGTMARGKKGQNQAGPGTQSARVRARRH